MKIKVWATIQNIGGELDIETFGNDGEANATARGWAIVRDGWISNEGIEEEDEGVDTQFEEFKKSKHGDMNVCWAEGACSSDNDTLHVEEITIEVPAKKVKVWTMATETDNGIQSKVFSSEAACFAAIWEFIEEYLDDETPTIDELKAKYGDDFFEAWEGLNIDDDRFNWDESEIEVPSPAPAEFEYELRYWHSDDEDGVLSFETEELRDGSAHDGDAKGQGIYRRPVEADALGLHPLLHVADISDAADARELLEALRGRAAQQTLLDARELATVFAALRHWQTTGSEHTMDFNEIATGNDEFAALDTTEIDALCQRINYGCEADKSF